MSGKLARRRNTSTSLRYDQAPRPDRLAAKNFEPLRRVIDERLGQIA